MDVYVFVLKYKKEFNVKGILRRNEFVSWSVCVCGVYARVRYKKNVYCKYEYKYPVFQRFVHYEIQTTVINWDVKPKEPI